MSKSLTRTYSLRKPVRPLIDIDEDDDDQRRDSSGRKRVAVVPCLLETSSDEIDNDVVPVEKPSNILWLSFYEICHIRAVLTEISITHDKQYSQIRNGRICFHCRKRINGLYFLPSFLRLHDYEVCFICQQFICKKCAYFNFLPPVPKLPIPIRIQSLIKPQSSPTIIKNTNEKSHNSNKQTKTICCDCFQIFNEHVSTAKSPAISPTSPFRRTFSLPPTSSTASNENRHTRHRRHRPFQITNCKIETTTLTTTSLVTSF